MTIEETLKALLERMDKQIETLKNNFDELDIGLKEISKGLKAVDEEMISCKKVLNVHNN